MTDQSLRRMFREFNKRWFDGRVPEPDVIRFGKEDDDGSIEGHGGKVVLQLHRDFARHPNHAAIVLLHEMAHALLPECQVAHGHRFGAEIVRLWALGAYEYLL